MSFFWPVSQSAIHKMQLINDVDSDCSTATSGALAAPSLTTSDSAAVSSLSDFDYDNFKAHFSSPGCCANCQQKAEVPREDREASKRTKKAVTPYRKPSNLEEEKARKKALRDYVERLVGCPPAEAPLSSGSIISTLPSAYDETSVEYSEGETLTASTTSDNSSDFSVPISSLTASSSDLSTASSPWPPVTNSRRHRNCQLDICIGEPVRRCVAHEDTSFDETQSDASQISF